jgi:hypothetical protein
MPKLNKPSQPGYRYAHPEETSAKSYVPHPRERVFESQASDVERINRGLNPTAQREYNRRLQQEAGGRAITRTLGRAGLGQLALEGGYEAGRALDEATGVGKKLVDKSGLGAAAERFANMRDKVELSKEAKDRIARGDLEDAPDSSRPAKARKVVRDEEDTSSIAGKLRPGRNEEIDDDTRENAGGYKRGGKISVSKASKRADGIAKRGKTRGRYL